MFGTLILDLDGPILEGRARHYRCYTDILQEFGGPPLALDEYWALKRARVNRHDLLARSGLGAHYDAFLKAWLERIEQPAYLRLDVVQPAVVSTLTRWRQQGKRLVLATMRQSEPNLLEQLEGLELRPFFEKIVAVGIESAGLNKGGEVLRQLPDLRGDETLWIGDTEIDFRAGRSLQTSVALLGCGLRDPAYLASLGPDYFEADLATLAGVLERV